ncbi:MAG: hypothetical protein AB8F95_11045, partial [Bacteroidia bacterium]
MRFFIAILLLTAFATAAFAQTDTTVRKPDIDVHFLLNYYEQDGVHSAVTGGEGTQELQDRSSLVVVKAPLDSFRTLHVHGGQNTYSSASTDRIDTRMSSASRKDTRARLYVGYGWTERNKPWEALVEAGGSIESDYTSTSIRASYTRHSLKKNWDWSVGIQSF